MVVYVCDKCTKEFTKKSTYKNHLKRKTPCKKIIKISKNIEDEINLNPNKNHIESEKNHIESKKNHIESENNKICSYCEREFATNSNMNRHMKNNCKAKKLHDDNKKEKEKIFEKLLNQMKELKKQNIKLVNELIEQNKKIHKLELSKKIINKNNNNNNIVNSNNNITNNNTFNIVAFGNENLTSVNDDVFKSILNKGFMAIPKFVQYLHFNKNIPENHNVYIPNIQSKYAMIYDGQDWNLVDKSNIIDTLYDEKEMHLEDKFTEFYDSLNISTKKKFERFLDQQEDDKIKNQIKENIKLLLYNKKNIVMITKKITKNKIY